MINFGENLNQMNSDKISKLEKSPKLKKRIFGKSIWKNYAIVPPSLLLFVGIFGMIYLLNLDKLISVYTIPFAVIFILGTILFKATKRHIVTKRISDNETFIVCLAIPFVTEGKKATLLFSTSKNRNNKYYLEKEKQDLLADFINYNNKNSGIIPTNKEDIFLTSLPLTKKFSTNTNKSAEGYWLVYTGGNSVHFLTNDDIRKS